MSWSDFQNDATLAVWKPALDVILEGCRQYSADHPELGCTLVPLAWDSPDVELSWNSGGLSRNLHVTLTNKQWPVKVQFSGNVWFDQPDQQRQFRALDLSTIEAATPSQLRDELNANIEAAVEQISRLQLQLAAFRGTPTV